MIKLVPPPQKKQTQRHHKSKDDLNTQDAHRETKGGGPLEDAQRRRGGRTISLSVSLPPPLSLSLALFDYTVLNITLHFRDRQLM
jgi:hypothetical protein